MIVVHMELMGTRNATFQNNLTINLRTSFHINAIDHHPTQFRIEHHISEMLTLEMGWIKHDDMVNGLHHNGTIIHFDSPPVEESIVRDVVFININLHM